MIEIRNVSFSYEDVDHDSLKDINLFIKQGECVLLCGKSGCENYGMKPERIRARVKTAARDLKTILAFLKAQGKTIVLAEHRIWYLKDIADRAIYIEDGRIAAQIPHDYEFLISSCDHVIHIENGKIKAEYLLDNAGEKRLRRFFFQKCCEKRPFSI